MARDFGSEFHKTIVIRTGLSEDSDTAHIHTLPAHGCRRNNAGPFEKEPFLNPGRRKRKTPLQPMRWERSAAAAKIGRDSLSRVVLAVVPHFATRSTWLDSPGRHSDVSAGVDARKKECSTDQQAVQNSSRRRAAEGGIPC